jgi:NAD(P)-dependent dehydrogenase (short-subunit alcohol dehydrogenase family)
MVNSHCETGCCNDNSERKFTKKIVVITGSGGGLGRAAALKFASEGAIIAGCDLNEAANNETAELIRSAGGTMHSTAPLDLTDEVATTQWINSVVEDLGGIDVLFANAGATKFNPITDVSLDEWHFVLAHELDVVFIPVKAAWEALKSSQGNIVLVGSTAGVTGSVTNTRIAHSATKGGVIAMAKQLAGEGAQFGIRANSVSPGMVATPATAKDLLAPDHPMAGIAQHIPLKRVGTVEEIANCVVFLASDEAAYVTGANLMVDGGWSAVLPGGVS